jgi:hypothetical protein
MIVRCSSGAGAEGLVLVARLGRTEVGDRRSECRIFEFRLLTSDLLSDVDFDFRQAGFGFRCEVGFGGE